MNNINKLISTILMLVILPAVFASDISFSGGFTQVNLQDGNHVVSLSGKANVKTDDVELSADKIKLYGEDYMFVECKGNIVVNEKKNDIQVNCTDLFYNRSTEKLISDGWVEISDLKNNAKLSGAWLEFSTQGSQMEIQIKAKIEKDTDSGPLSCSADSILYNADAQLLTLKGNAAVKWGDDSYKASLIYVNIDTEDITLHGSITGEVNGN